MSTSYYTQSAKVDLDLWSRDPKSIGFLPAASTTDMWSLKVIGQKQYIVVVIVSTRYYTQSAKVDFDLWPYDPKSIGFLLSSSTTYMWSLKVIGQKLKSLLCPQGLIHTVPSWPWTLTQCPKINRVTPLIIHNLQVKFESDLVKTVVTIVSTRSYTQSAKIDLDLWPCDPKSIGFLLSSSTTYMWSFKVIGQNL